MPAISGGETVMMAAPGSGLTSVDGFHYDGPGPHPLAGFLGNAYAYDAIYERQLWVSVAVNKLVGLQTQLPHKVYRRRRTGREEAASSPFGRLIAKPSRSMSADNFWGWFCGMRHIHGRAFAAKVRDRGGRPVELTLIHPTRMRFGPEGGGFAAPGPVGTESGPNRWWFRQSNGEERRVDRREFLYWQGFSPRSPVEGMSPLEPLRDTLENEAGARAASAALWRNGGRHSLALKYNRSLGDDRMVAQRLADQYQRIHGGVNNWNRPLVLEDGMEPVQLTMNNEELQYIEGRRLNREEVSAAFDIPPPAIQILDRATFSNIVEQNRSLYRQTMPPIIKSFESMIDFDLRDGSFGDGPPDFGEAFYCELLIDGVMRGDPEKRVESNARAIQTGQMTPNEVRELENLPPVAGGDTLLINSAVIPIEAAAAQLPAAGAGATVDLDGGPGNEESATTSAELTPAARSTVMGRLSRPATLDDVDVDRLVDGLDEVEANAVRGAVAIARHGQLTVAQLRQIIKEIGL